VLGTTPTCDDFNVCTAESCSSALNRCAYDAVPDGTPCDDRNPSTTNDVCRNGICNDGYATRRVSETADHQSPNFHSEKPFLSDDGRYIAFQSESTNLAPGGDGNNATDVFVVDVAGGAPVRVSTSAAGTEGNNISRLGTPNRGLPGNAISGNGQLIAFLSLANNLVPNDTNNDWDVFVKDRISGDIRRVSVTSSGGEANTPGNAFRWRTYANLNGEPALSQDGRYVVFSSFASNLVANDRNDLMDIFRHDLLTGETILVSISSSGAQGNGDSDMPSVSQDGNCVAFRSLSGNINHDPLRPDNNSQYDIYLRELSSGVTRRISQAYDGGETNNVSYYPRINAECTQISYVSWADNLVPGDTNETLDVFSQGTAGGPTLRVNVTATGVQGNLRTGGPPSINRNGRYIAFYSWATIFGTEDNNLFCNYRAIVNSKNCVDIFVKDMWTGELRMMSLTSNGDEAWQNSQDPSISGDGTGLAFGSYANNLDPDKWSGYQDIFYVRTLLAPSP